MNHDNIARLVPLHRFFGTVRDTFRELGHDDH